MTFTASQLNIKPTDVRPGQYARFDAFGHFLRADNHLTNGLGMIYACNRDGSFSRCFF